ncbi:transcriptional regulatory protein CitT [Thalassobacillus devorans]|uniref:Transcriptional regulatory protein CitT n=1 Tax=Thalassobacillus devorans TaxID=279813 RepID=A0ABQ1PMT3_9BACI|nr:response regulator [Thalassobacillus devorans]NIK30258.1 CitB family two-component system response regulator CitT [Thalassobacillus devorans]GGC99655.1 transcriptional regulatory protein CitT [Thalassobacillus devorans]
MIKVVIAEDDFRVAQLHEKFLSEITGFQVVGKALNGKETLELIADEQPDLLLLDVYMPDRLGTELLHDVRELSPTIDIIMITAANDKAMIEIALKYGVIDYIIKPVSLDRFKKTIHDYQEKQQMIDSTDTFDQDMVDQLIGSRKNTIPPNENMPKGIDPLTLDKVRSMLAEAKDGLTAEQASDQMGASKTTARRYLEYLISIEEGKAEMRYGKVGRPERKYYLHT